MARTLSNDLLDRLAENEQLALHPGLGKWSSAAMSFVGLHGFWVLLGLSFLGVCTMYGFGWQERMSAIALGWLYE